MFNIRAPTVFNFPGLNNYFFGLDREGILTVEKFLDFQRSLQNEILKLEFSRKIRDNDAKKDGSDSEVKRISEKVTIGNSRTPWSIFYLPSSGIAFCVRTTGTVT